MTKNKVGRVAVWASIIITLVIAFASVIMSYAGTKQKADQAYGIAVKTEGRVQQVELSVSGLHAEVKSTHEDVKIIKEHLLK